MSECLVTTLPASIDNSDLLKFGEIRYSIKSGGYVSMRSTEAFSVEILTPGVTFTSGGAIGQSSVNVPANTTTAPEVSGDCEVSLTPKYKLTRFNSPGATSAGRVSIDLAMLKYCTDIENLKVCGTVVGDIANLKNMTKLTYCEVVDKGVYGDLSDLFTSTTLTQLIFAVSGATAKVPDIKGDISYLSRVSTALVQLFLPKMAQLTGNVSVFSGAFAVLRDVDIEQCTGISGDVGSFANHSALQNLKLINTGVSGTLGDLLVGTPALKYASFPPTVQFTAADAATADALMAANGGSMTTYGHYFAGGTLVDSYS